MGTDIHIGVEARHKVDDWENKFGHDAAKWTGVLVPPGPNATPWGQPSYLERNYALFYFLSGVRYGCSMHNQIPCRGLPADIDQSPTAHQEFHSIANSGMAAIFFLDGYFGDYGHTWATVGELLDLPWDEATTTYVPSVTMREHAEGFIAWLEELNRLWGRDNCRVIWGFDS